MKYCRYCAFCIPGNDCPYYCTKHENPLSENQVRRITACKDFSLSELGDVDTGKPYSQREHRGKVVSLQQENLFTEG